jgi:DHA1 family bicyclomycin/chloramphenicol resistance-like MFS transporter
MRQIESSAPGSGPIADPAKSRPRFSEFVALMALMIALVAMSIDAMLPALSEIGSDLAVHRDNATQLVISFFIFGIAVGQAAFGPVSDTIGRKPVVYVGFCFFTVGCLLSIFAVNFQMMLTGRLIQGLGLAGPRIMTMAIIRDRYEGRAMARVMSFVMAVFIAVPAVAPAFGLLLVVFAGWRSIFVVIQAMALITLSWFALRQPETLAPGQRMRLSLRRVVSVFREIFAIRASVGYTVAAGFIFGAFQGYLNSAQQIFQAQYQKGVLSPLYYSLLALCIGAASLANSRLVMRFGMRLLIRLASMTLGGVSAVFFLAAVMVQGHPPLWALMLHLVIAFACLGLLFGNLNALAMKPLGHIAGSGATLVGSLSILMAVPLGILIGQAYNGTILPLAGGFALLGGAAAWVIVRLEHRKTLSQFDPCA